MNSYINKKYLLIVLIITSIFIVSSIIYLYLTNTEDLILKENITLNFREKAYTSDLINKLNGELISNPLIDTSEVGEKEVLISYYNHYGFTEEKLAKIEIKDITPPTIVVNNNYTITKGAITSLLDTIFCADDYDDNVNCKIEGKYNLNEVGEYKLNIIATDNSNNITNKSFTLNVIEKTNSNNNTSKEETKFKDILTKYKTKNNSLGLDISKWQGDIDFTKLKNQGVEFVMIKIGGQTKKGSKIVMDPKFKDNIEGAISNDIKVGIYFYSHATNIEEAKHQAQWVIKNIKDYKIDLPIAFDWENWNTYTTYHISFNTLNKIASAFLTTIEEKGYNTLLYSSKYYLENVWYQEDYTNWIAHYTTDSKDKDKYYMWQIANNGTIEGITSYVDIDILYNN